MGFFRPLIVAILLPGLPGWCADPHPDAAPNVHPPGKVDVPANVPFIVTDPKSLPGLVLDETEAELKGQWQYSTHTPPYVGLGYLHDQKSGKGKKSVTWRPRFPESGVYEVRISHCANVRRATNTPVIIRHADGITTVRINQQQTPPLGNLFRSLGSYRFSAGESGSITLSNEGTAADKVAIADAVQFLLQPSGSSPSHSPDTPSEPSSSSPP